MLLSLYSAYKDPNAVAKTIKLHDEERPRTNGMNGHARIPNNADSQAADAQEFELEGLDSDDDEPERPLMNGKPRVA